MNKPLLFRSGGGSSFQQTADSLLTNDTVEVLLGLSEGPIKGPVSGPKSIFLDGTQIVNDNNESNFSAMNLQFWPGSDPPGDQVSMALGGFASPIQVNTTLVQNTTVTRQGVQTGITAADFRIVISELYRQDTKGIYTDELQLKFEYKKLSDTNWLPCFSSPPGGTPSYGSPDGNNTSWDIPDFYNAPGSFSFDRIIYGGDWTGAPTTTPPATTSPPLGVNNTGNVYSWDTGSLTWIQLESDNTNSNDIIFYETVGNQSVSHHLFRNQSGTPTANDIGDVWDTGNYQYLMWNGSAWVTPGAYDVSQYTPDPQYLDAGVWSWTGKVSSTTPINIRVYVAAATEAYEFRVTKLTTDTTTEHFSSVAWESLEEIKQSAWTFEDLAMIKLLGRASDQFTSLPALESECEGRIVKVPTNYDPVARTYTGVWDGTYQLAYTNNPAWILLDFVENTRYGLSSIYPHTADKWAFYAWAQYCDVMVPTAAGGTQPRWTFNDWMTQPRDAHEMAQYIAGAAGAIFLDDGNGYCTVMVDQDGDAVALFTPENVTPDGFQYSYTDRLTRSNQVVVSFSNPLLNGATDKRIVEDKNDQASVGVITDDFIAVGCYDVDEALRRARRRLITSETEKESVTFTTNRQGRYLLMWDIILVADPDQGRGETGRVREVTGTNSVSLRDPLTLEAGFSYQVVFFVPNAALTPAFETVTLDVTTPAGTVTALDFTQALPTNLPEYAVFSLQCQQTVGLPKPYRVLSLQDDSSNGELVTVTAMELNRNKYSYIDQSQDLGTVDYSNFYYMTPDPPANLKITVSYVQVADGSDRVLTISWDASPSQFVRGYKVKWSIDGTAAGTAETEGLSADIHGANRGLYKITVVAESANGKISTPVTILYDTVGSVRSIPSPKNLKLTNGDTATVFSAVDAVFGWDACDPDPNFGYYQVEVYDPTATPPALLRTEKVGSSLTYTYDFGRNKMDGLHRDIELSVCTVDQDGNQSEPLVLSVSNPPPPLAEATVELNPYGLHLLFTPPADLDYAGILVWLSQTSGFTPDASTLVYQDKGNPTINIVPGTTYYFRYAFYDHFGQTGLNVSAEQSILAPLVSLSDSTFQSEIDDLNSAVTKAQDDASAAYQEAATLAWSMVRNANNRKAVQDYVNEKIYVAGAPVGPMVEQQKTTTDSLVSNQSLMGVKSADGATWIFNTTTCYFDSNGQSIADTLTGINTNINNNASAIVNEQTARSNADSSFASQLSLIGATNGADNAFVLNTSTVQIGGGETLGTRLTSINTSLNNNSAAISNEQTARVNGDNANASSISSLQTTVNGNSASISTIQSVQADHTGKLQAYFGIVAAAGSDPAYVIVDATNYGSSIALAATTIALYDTAGGHPLKVMEVIGGYAHFSRLIIIDAGNYRKVSGPAFGASANLVEWFGPNTVDPASATIANSIWAQATDGKIYYGGSQLQSGGSSGPYLTLDTTSVSVSGTGGGPFTTPAMTATLNGAVGAVTYAISASDAGVTVNNPTGPGSTFSASPGTGATLGALVVYTATDGGTGKQYQMTGHVRFTSTS